MGVDPAVLRQLQDLRLAQAARRGVVDIFDGSGTLFEAGELEPCRELAILAVDPFIVDQKADQPWGAKDTAFVFRETFKAAPTPRERTTRSSPSQTAGRQNE